MSTKATPALEIPSPQPSTRATNVPATKGLGWYFAFFFVSGFCSILYELIWLRLAMAQFGVTTAMVSIVLSSFMAGLGIGSWASGALLQKYARRVSSRPLHLYAVTELLIGCSGVIVPLELLGGRYVLEHLGSSSSLSSSGYYLAAGVWVACTLIPWCALMGATIPFGMFAIRSERRSESKRSFSYLYVANVLGAVIGTVIPLALIEVWGFTSTLRVGTFLNLSICAAAFWLADRQSKTSHQNASDNKHKAFEEDHHQTDQAAAFHANWQELIGNGTLWLLFATGLTSMGIELVWTRLYTFYIGTFVYSFAQILGIYLLATFLGSALYRYWSRRHDQDAPVLWLLVWLAALIALLTADPRAHIHSWKRIPFGIVAFSGLLGFITPRLVDRFSEGDPARAGVGYAVNVVGCILGPLIAGFALLPYVDERYALVILALPWLAVGVWSLLFGSSGSPKRFASLASCAAILCASAALILRTHSYIQEIPDAHVKRDSTATVVAAGQGMKRKLYVNGVNMTVLTPLTKVMAALPLAFLDHPPQKALVICFGMGTTHRSMLSWGIDSTAVDLVPSVPEFFSYFHPDAPQLVASPRSHIVIDDGRRFLERTSDQYDVIVIDPPPPIPAAGSSLLYSREFYAAAKKRLRPDGILAQWYPGGDRQTGTAITRALMQSFPYVRAFLSLENYGVHYLASMQPIPSRSPAELANRMPPAAAADLVEWGPLYTPQEQFSALLQRELNLQWLLALDKNAPALQDDRPINEYYLIRYLRHPQP
ncbi:MAG TPA: MFS transporter [Candidatus Sulfotelmatobacter sp.]